MSAMTKYAMTIKTMANIEANECRWPIGDPREAGFHFCGARQAEGRPYCVTHWDLSFVPGRSRHQAAPASSPAARPLALARVA